MSVMGIFSDSHLKSLITQGNLRFRSRRENLKVWPQF